MTIQRSILAFLHNHPHLGLCDDCLAKQLRIRPRQTVNRLCRDLTGRVFRAQGSCPNCLKRKILNALPQASQSSVPASLRARKIKSRSQDLKTQLNEALISIFRLEKRDYYQELTFAQLLELKQGLARVHDTVSLKLTFQLVHWIADRFQLTEDRKAALWKQVDEQSANASGFDLRWDQPQIIAEVKGCIPMNGGKVFGSAQWKGLTNDFRQMLGLPALGKTKEQLSPRSKVHDASNRTAIKLLALYDSPDVRAAATQWQQSMKDQAWFKELSPSFDLQEAPGNGPLDDPSTVYLVYLTPEHP